MKQQLLQTNLALVGSGSGIMALAGKRSLPSLSSVPPVQIFNSLPLRMNRWPKFLQWVSLPHRQCRLVSTSLSFLHPLTPPPLSLSPPSPSLCSS